MDIYTFATVIDLLAISLGRRLGCSEAGGQLDGQPTRGETSKLRLRLPAADGMRVFAHLMPQRGERILATLGSHCCHLDPRVSLSQHPNMLKSKARSRDPLVFLKKKKSTTFFDNSKLLGRAPM